MHLDGLIIIIIISFFLISGNGKRAEKAPYPLIFINRCCLFHEKYRFSF